MEFYLTWRLRSTWGRRWFEEVELVDRYVGGLDSWLVTIDGRGRCCRSWDRLVDARV